MIPSKLADVKVVWTPKVAYVTKAFLVYRAALLLAVWAAQYCLPKLRPNGENALPEHPFWERFCHWDSHFYHQIVEHGYAAGSPTSAFFPLYPYLVRWFSIVIGNTWAAGLAISHLATFAALFAVYDLACRYGGDASARRAVVFALIFPGTLFFSCFYPESLYLLVSTGALLNYERGRYVRVGVWGFLAAITRPTGVLLLPVLAFGAVYRERFRWRHLPLSVLSLLAIPGGMAAFALLLRHQTGDSLGFLHHQGAWSRTTTFPWLSLAQAAQDAVAAGSHPAPDIKASSAVMRLFDMGGAVFLFFCAAYAVRRLDSAQALFIVVSVLVPLSSGLVLAIERQAACVAPAYVVMAMWARTQSRQAALVAGCSVLLAVQAVLFSCGLAVI